MDTALAAELAALEAGARLRRPREVEARRGAEVRSGASTLIDFSSNDYLGLAADPRLARAAAAALDRAGTGAAAARLISGTHPLHTALEAQLAALKRLPASLLFPTGYAANTGAIPALAGPGDVIYSDALNHASLIDGCRLSRATLRVFPHLDTDTLGALLEADRGRFRRRLLVVDAVFSMDGDLFPLPALVELAGLHDAWCYVDDAHGTGVLGAEGRGALEHWGVEGEVEVVMGTLGKALGCAGAFVAGSVPLRDWLLNRARTFVYTTGTPPALAAAASEAVRIAQAEGWRRDTLRSHARRLRTALTELGLTVPGEADGHIVPVLTGSPEATLQAEAGLRARGFLVGAVRPPTVPEGASRLRITLSAAHSTEQVDALIDALGAVLSGPASAASPAGPPISAAG